MKEASLNFVHQITVYHIDKNYFAIKRNKLQYFTYKGFLIFYL